LGPANGWPSTERPLALLPSSPNIGIGIRPFQQRLSKAKSGPASLKKSQEAAPDATNRVSVYICASAQDFLGKQWCLACGQFGDSNASFFRPLATKWQPTMKSTIIQKPVVFFKVAWLQSYQGGEDDEAVLTEDETQVNLFERHDGSDGFNFLPTKSAAEPEYERYYIDYCGIHTRRLNLLKLKVDPDRARIHPICIVLVARKPQTSQHYIVGWYKNATLVTAWQDTEDVDGNELKYQAYAPVERASRLLPVDKRNFKFPEDTSGNVILSPTLRKEYVSDVWDYINQFPS
jgi:hypothetical protein